jgi:AcrR family transcriptional regulator
MSMKAPSRPERALAQVSEASARLSRILDEATTLFDEQGFMRTTTEDVAAAAGITKRTLYRYVNTKESLLLLIHERFLDRHVTAMQNTQGLDVEQRFRRFVCDYIAVIVEYQASVRVFLEEMKNLSTANREAVLGRRDEFEAGLRSILREGIAEGRFAEIDVEVVSMVILGALSSACKWYSAAGPLGPQELGDLLADLLLNGLLGDDRASAGETRTVRIPARPQGRDDATRRKSIRPHLLDKAMVLFAERGYDATTTRELAEACEMNKSALHYHIGTKEDLLFDIQDRFALRSIARVTSVVEEMSDRPIGDVFTATMRAHCAAMETERAAVAVFTEQMRYLHPGHFESVQKLSNEYIALMREVVRAATANERLRPYGSPVTLAIVGAANSIHRWYRPNGRLTITEISDTVATLFLEGLSLAPGAKK